MIIKEIPLLVKDIVGFECEVFFDTSNPDSSLKKLTNITQVKELEWKPKTSLADGDYLKWCLL